MKTAIVDKLAKLLRLSKGTSNEHEAAAAARTAQRLMTEHRITLAELELSSGSTEVREPMKTEKAGASARWRRLIVSSIASANQCGAYLRLRRVYVYGLETDVALVMQLVSFCCSEVDTLAAGQRGRGPTWINGYRVGIAIAIARAVELEGAQTVRELAQMSPRHSHALVKIQSDADAVEAYGRSIGIRGVARRRPFDIDADALAHGLRDGRRVYPGRNGRRRLEAAT